MIHGVGMDESINPVRSAKQSQPRGAKSSFNCKSTREAPVQRDGAKSATPRSKENFAAAKDEHNIGSQANRGPGKTFTDNAQDKRKGRPPRLSRLTGRTSSGERGKGKATSSSSSQHQLLPEPPDSRSSLSADSSPSANRATSTPKVPATPEKGLSEQAKSSSTAPAKEKSHGRFTRCFLID